MIVIGADAHKQTHTLVAADAATGELRAERTVAAREPGFAEIARWARELDAERVWAIEDCRNVSGGLERWLVAAGERVVRVAPRLMAGARRFERRRGKSDPIDAAAVAHAAIREGLDRLPAAQLDSQALEIRLLVDHHDDLVKQRTADQCRLRGTCTICGPSSRSRLPRSIARSGARGSPAAWRVPSSPPGCAWCAPAALDPPRHARGPRA